jgi:competence protein ComEA
VKTTLSVLLALLAVFNLNTATETELETLPGVGPALAKRIVEFRREKGGFRRMEELLAVPGVSEKKWQTLKQYLRVE